MIGKSSSQTQQSEIASLDSRLSDKPETPTTAHEPQPETPTILEDAGKSIHETSEVVSIESSSECCSNATKNKSPTPDSLVNEVKEETSEATETADEEEDKEVKDTEVKVNELEPDAPSATKIETEVIVEPVPKEAVDENKVIADVTETVTDEKKEEDKLEDKEEETEKVEEKIEEKVEEKIEETIDETIEETVEKKVEENEVKEEEKNGEVEEDVAKEEEKDSTVVQKNEETETKEEVKNEEDKVEKTSEEEGAICSTSVVEEAKESSEKSESEDKSAVIKDSEERSEEPSNNCNSVISEKPDTIEINDSLCSDSNVQTSPIDDNATTQVPNVKQQIPTISTVVCDATQHLADGVPQIVNSNGTARDQFTSSSASTTPEHASAKRRSSLPAVPTEGATLADEALPTSTAPNNSHKQFSPQKRPRSASTSTQVDPIHFG